ncbi:MAG: hypothetical protein CO034_01020 [Parcubacteria group bacterium CG_4_9_14_0_2_um_filter_35_11]|nr:MAG: hypothetical protein COS98_01885 [Parcubacteria group bacterium CG07_land_8_20_14_0_80_35_11]PJC47867.1 MAG: hypothetical protein CO034_01020 [Parcubacteria group bacterium CG_4_9_14_0_2_um_filter_35_11]
MRITLRLILVVLIILLALFIYYKRYSGSSLKSIKINDIEILVEIADTPEKRAKGLSDRQSLPENQGMLFLFDKPDFHSFWMKDTLIPLDFIWIRDDKVVGITQNIKPEGYQPPHVLTPEEKINAVLEVNAGFVKKSNLKVGDKISF